MDDLHILDNYNYNVGTIGMMYRPCTTERGVFEVYLRVVYLRVQNIESYDVYLRVVLMLKQGEGNSESFLTDIADHANSSIYHFQICSLEDI